MFFIIRGPSHPLRREQGLRFAWQQADLKHTLHPDALFYVADPVNPGKAFCYFLEIERAKLGNYRNGEPQILRKLRTYYDYFNSTGCENESTCSAIRAFDGENGESLNGESSVWRASK